MKNSFVVLALSAAFASAQDLSCTWSPTTSVSPSSSSGPDFPIDFPFDFTETKPTFPDILCKKKPADPTDNWDWWDVEGQISSLKDSVTFFRNTISSIQKCEEEALTSWKKQYPFSCPATQPSVEDWKLFVPTPDLLTLKEDAQLKDNEAA